MTATTTAEGQMRRLISMTSLTIALSCDSSSGTRATVSTDVATDGTGGTDTADATDGVDGTNAPDATDGSDATEGSDATVGSDAVEDGALSFKHVYETVFVPQGCSAGYCHGAGSGGMQFGTHDEAYAELVNRPATQTDCGLATRVVPGAPDDSVLWVRVRPESGPACSTQKMPSGTNGLDDASAQLIYDWIEDGAKP